MNPFVNILIGFLFSVGCLAYLYGIYKACAISLQKNPVLSDMSPFLSSIVTSIGAVLATNLGAVLGFTISDPNSALAEAARNPFSVFSNPTPSNEQVMACFLYVLTLFAVSVVWGIKKFTDDPLQVVPTVPQLTKTFLGVIVGVFAIILVKK